MTISAEIMKQLGGKRFVIMTGAKNIVNRPNGVTMSLPRNVTGGMQCCITLNSTDLYDIDFFSLHRKTFVIQYKKRFTDIGVENLSDVFSQATGFAVRL
jgi:hypothetical protein